MNIFIKKRIIKIILIIILVFSSGVIAAEVLNDSIWVDTGMCANEDPKTGLTCYELQENPEQDVYYVVKSSKLNDNIWESAHQNPNSVRWDYWRTKFIVKYNAREIPRSEFGLDKALGSPMNHDEILAYLNDPLNGFYNPEEYDYSLLPVPVDAPIVAEEPPLEEIPQIEILPEVIEQTDNPAETNPTEEVTIDPTSEEGTPEPDPTVPENPNTEPEIPSDTGEPVSEEESMPPEESNPQLDQTTESQPSDENSTEIIE